jgi:hypothetical protein
MRGINSLVLTALLGFAVPAWAGNSIRDVTRELQKYNAEERKLANAGEQSPNELMAHWQRLAQVRTTLAKLDARGALQRLRPNERVVIRHELAELLGSAADVSAVKGTTIPERFVEADEVRKRVLAEIAAIADRSLEFDIKEILGVKVDAGGT